MRIAYIIYPEVIISNRSNGVRGQAVAWGKSLQQRGIEVVFVNNWGDYDWNTFDAFHFFGMGMWALPLAKRLRSFGKKLIISPIIDPFPNPNYRKASFKYKFSEALNNKFNFNDNIYDTATLFSAFDVVCARTEFEKFYISKVYHIPLNNITVIPLSYSENLGNESVDFQAKENFCLHISSIFHPRKNVIRLIQAAKMYKFNLILAGNKGTEKQYYPIKQAIGDAKNIQVLGFISEEEKIVLYKRAKVFALPSIQEGVGIVALDAALMGCEIVISNIKGPKEYYKGKCLEVNPFNVNDIGKSVCIFMDGSHSFQPYLSEEIRKAYSPYQITELLKQMYATL